MMQEYSGAGRQQDKQGTSLLHCCCPPNLSWAEGPEALVGSRQVLPGSGGRLFCKLAG